jgi:hypothetical protein
VKGSKLGSLQNQPRKGVFWDHALFVPHEKESERRDTTPQNELRLTDPITMFSSATLALVPARLMGSPAGFARRFVRLSQSLPIPLNSCCVAQTRSSNFPGRTSRGVRPLLFIFFSSFPSLFAGLVVVPKNETTKFQRDGSANFLVCQADCAEPLSAALVIVCGCVCMVYVVHGGVFCFPLGAHPPAFFGTPCRTHCVYVDLS